MRTMTDARRKAILEAAHTAFAASGFRDTTVDAIARLFGGSKATIYKYFPSKEDLFVAVTETFVLQTVLEAFHLLEHDGELVETLTKFGRLYLASVLNSDVMGLKNVVAQEGQNSDIATFFYHAGPARGQDDIRRFLERQRERGRISLADSTLAAHQLTALLEAEFFEARFYGATGMPGDAEIAAAVDRALHGFFRIYPRD
ncbi:MAG: TetR/AcrR family transcriptional regulator [Azospirillaceae bacterium]|nr:TetR/AcrR family transcriptional regulator [Azospirillaceae bacterium]